MRSGNCRESERESGVALGVALGGGVALGVAWRWAMFDEPFGSPTDCLAPYHHYR